jgi:hypothetical protein
MVMTGIRLASQATLTPWHAVLIIVARLVKTVVSNSTFDRGSLSPTYIKPFDVFANGGKTGDRLTSLDNFRNWLINRAA